MGLSRVDVICNAGEQGVPYFRMSHEELRHEVEQAKSI
jgi:hypothetical protein